MVVLGHIKEYVRRCICPRRAMHDKIKAIAIFRTLNDDVVVEWTVRV
jgi:hypothetical protein